MRSSRPSDAVHTAVSMTSLPSRSTSSRLLSLGSDPPGFVPAGVVDVQRRTCLRWGGVGEAASAFLLCLEEEEEEEEGHRRPFRGWMAA